MWSLDVGSSLDEVAEERRKAKRYPIGRNVVIHPSIRKGTKQAQPTAPGKTLNISSHGVLLTTELPLAKGSSVELAIDWPVSLNETCGLNFVVSGSVVRASGDTVAVRIQKYHFRTRRTPS